MMSTASESSMSEKSALIKFSDDSRSLRIESPKLKSLNQTSASRYPRLVTLAILVTELFERLTYYSISGNLVLFCTNNLHYGDDSAVTLSLVFTGTVYVIPLFGGLLADSVSTRFNAIYFSVLVYLVGATILPIVSYTFPAGHGFSLDANRGLFIFALGLIAVGTGGIKSNVSPFGAQQVESLGKEAVENFFNWFYWFINLGAAVAYLVVSYIQQEVNFFIGFLIPALSICVGLIIFYIPRKYYVYKASGDGNFVDFFRIPFEGVRRKWGNVLSYPSFLDYARFSNGGRFPDKKVDDFLQLVYMFPVFGCVVIFWTIYSQMQSTFFLQAERMDISIGRVKLSVASLNVFNTAVILLVTPIMDRFVYPWIERVRGTRLGVFPRMAIGLIFASCSVLVGGILEIARKNEIQESGGFAQLVGNGAFNASHISVFAQVPQFIFIGLGEIFTSISGLEFAFTEAPQDFKSVVMGIFLLTNAFGNYFGSLLLLIVNSSPSNAWLPAEMNNGHFEYFCFLLTALGFLNFVLFIMISRWYGRVRTRHILSCARNAARYRSVTSHTNSDLEYSSQIDFRRSHSL